MAKTAKKFSIGVDYGTNSVRALVVDTADGTEVASHVFNYPSGDHGILLDKKEPNLARQNPADYIEGFFKSVRRAVNVAKKKARLQAGTRRRHRCRYDGLDADPGRPRRDAPCDAVEI